MFKLRAFFRNINLLNIILILTIIILIKYVVASVFEINIEYIPSVEKTFKEKTSINLAQNSNEVQLSSLSDYSIISDENLFHPERKIPVEKKEEKPLPKPEFVLYGTLITDDLSIAFLEDLKAPRTSPGRGKRQTALKKGDVMSGFTLNEIEVDKVVMVSGEEKMMLYVRDPNRPKIREATVSSQQPRTKPQQPQVSTPPKLPLTPPPEPVKTEILPPRSPEEQSVFEFFERKRK